MAISGQFCASKLGESAEKDASGEMPTECRHNDDDEDDGAYGVEIEDTRWQLPPSSTHSYTHLHAAEENEVIGRLFPNEALSHWGQATAFVGDVVYCVLGAFSRRIGRHTLSAHSPFRNKLVIVIIVSDCGEK